MTEKNKAGKGGESPGNIIYDINLLHTLINTLPDLIWLKDPEGRYLMCNPRFENFFGKKASEIVGRTDFDFMTAEQAVFFRDKDKAALEAGRSLTNTEWLTYADDGHKEIVETIKTPMYDNAGNIIGVLGIARDITDRFLAEENLKKSEEKYRYLFASNPAPMWIFDLETLEFLEVNEAAISHYGYTRKEFMSMTLKDIRPSEDVDKLTGYIKATTEDLNQAGIWRHIKKNGEIIHVDISSHLMSFDNRDARLVLIKDVTEKIKADRELKKLLRAVEQSPVTILITDKDGIIEYVNPKFTSMSGYSPEEALGRNVSFLKSPDSKPDNNKKLWDTISSGRDWQGEFRNVSKKGEIFTEFAAISPVFDENKNITHYIAIKEDITERKKDQEKLIKFSLAIEESSDPIFITSLDGTIEYINPAFEKTYGFTREEAIGKTPRILKSGVVPEETYKYLWDTLLSGNEVKGELKNKTKSGKIIDVEASNSPIHDHSGNLIGFISINRDISDRKLAQEELIKAKGKAEESDRLKTAFLNNISHEIRTPMNAILGFSALMSDPDITPQALESYIESIQKGSDQLLSIIVDIIAVSEVMAGTSRVQEEKINLNELLRRVIQPYKSLAEDKNIDFQLKLPVTGDKSEILTDKSKLTRILENLVSNAVRFTDSGHISAGYEIKKSMIEFCISDTGMGIPDKYQPKIFDNFFQVEHTLSRINEGTGLGLSVSKAYTELLGGEIWVESKPGRGSDFYFTVPYIKASPEKTDKKDTLKKPEQKPEKPTNILVAEDDASNSRLIAKLLSRLNVKVLHAKNGMEAVSLLKAHDNIDIVLLDIKMPELDGFQAAAQIREIRPEIILIAQTAYVDDAKVALDAGFNDFISKPFDRNNFISTIEKYIK